MKKNVPTATMVRAARTAFWWSVKYLAHSGAAASVSGGFGNTIRKPTIRKITKTMPVAAPYFA